MRSLERRLRSLEERRPVPSKPPVLFAIYDAPDQLIIGLEGGAGRVERRAGEPMDTLLVRAFQTLRSRFLWAVYAPADTNPTNTPPQLPRQAEPGPPALAAVMGEPGIGRRATVAELRRWGVLPQP